MEARNFIIIDSKSIKRIGSTITLYRKVSSFNSHNLKSEIFMDIEFEGKYYGGELTTQLETGMTTLRLDNRDSNHGNAFMNLIVKEQLQ